MPFAATLPGLSASPRQRRETRARRPRPPTALARGERARGAASIIRPPTCTGMMPTTLTAPQAAEAGRSPACCHFRPRREVDVERHRIAVDQDRHRARVAHDLRRRGERHRRHEHALARPQAERVDREMERGRAGVERHRVPAADGGRNSSSNRPTRGRSSASPSGARRRLHQSRRGLCQDERTGLPEAPAPVVTPAECINTASVRRPN